MIKSIKSIFLVSIPVIAIILLFSFIAAAAAKLDVTSPKDKTRTMEFKLPITGKAYSARELNINNTKVDMEWSGVFDAIAILRPGKNLINFSAVYPDGSKISRPIRVLKIVTYDDVERLYGNRPYWAKQQIITLLTLGIIEGYPDGTFMPEKPVSRGEFATWLARAKKLKISKPAQDVFFDVPKEHWRAPYIKAVVDAGLMNGLSTEKFGVDYAIKRAQVVEIIVRSYSLPQANQPKMPFTDVPSGYEYANYIQSAFAGGLVTGIPGKEKKFEPERDMKRAETAHLIANIRSVKALRAALYDFNQGYTVYDYCSIGTKPLIRKVLAVPASIVADGISPLKISADVVDAQGQNDISQVWADLTSVGGPNNAKMSLVEGGLFEVSFTVTSEVLPGQKIIAVSALDKSGLKTVSEAKFTVLKGKK